MVVDTDAVFSSLKAKQAAVIARRAEITAELSAIGYSAHAETGKRQAEAKATLAKLTAETATLQAEETSIEGALVEAGRRQAEARKTAQAVDEAERQIEIKRLEAEHRQAGKDSDLALEKLILTVMKRRDLQARMRHLGDSRGGELAGVTDKRCIETALMRLGRPFATVEPNQRLSFADADSRSAPKQRAAA